MSIVTKIRSWMGIIQKQPEERVNSLEQEPNEKDSEVPSPRPRVRKQKGTTEIHSTNEVPAKVKRTRRKSAAMDMKDDDDIDTKLFGVKSPNVENPFAVDNIECFHIYYEQWRLKYHLKPISACIKFKKGNTEIEQNFQDDTVSGIILQMKTFCEQL